MDDTVIARSETFRVRLEVDLYPEPPHDDGSSPILRVNRRGYSRTDVSQVEDVTSYRVHPRIIEALERWAYVEDRGEFERYLRAFHGVTQIEWYAPYDGDYAYVTFDPADWREEMGLTDEYMAAHPDTDFRLASMDEWKAYVEGDVYYLVIEEKLITVDVMQDDELDVEEEWEQIDSLSGLYGDDARQVAIEDLRAVAEAHGETVEEV